MNILCANIHEKVFLDSMSNMQQLQFPTGLATIAGAVARLRKDRIHVIDDYVQDLELEDLFDEVEGKSIDCILLSFYIGDYPYSFCKKVVGELARRFKKVKIVVGGSLATSVSALLQQNVVTNENQ